MKKFSVQCVGANMQEALEVITALPKLDFNQRNCLSLLTEEMFSMMAAVLSNLEAGFTVSREENRYTLELTTDVRVSPEARRQYLSISSDGKNLAERGLKGKMSALIEAMAVGSAMVPITGFDMDMNSLGYSHLWQLSSYLGSLSEIEKESAWDGMEKSIIANFADDVLIGVRNNNVEMIVKKAF